MKANTKPKATQALTESEQAKVSSQARAAQHLLTLRDARPVPPKYEFFEGENDSIGLGFEGENDAAAQLEMHMVVGCKNSDAVNMLTEQLMALSAADIEKHDARRMNRAIAMLDELAPTDGCEGMLAAQMVAVHVTAMQCFSRANLEGQTFEGRELNMKHGAKLSRIFAQQLQSLDKHRRNGQQQVIVKHVHVNEGGQAIVGDVTTGRGLDGKSAEQPHAPNH